MLDIKGKVHVLSNVGKAENQIMKLMINSRLINLE